MTDTLFNEVRYSLDRLVGDIGSSDIQRTFVIR